MGAALLTCVAMIVSLLGVVVALGSATFWPRPIERVTLRSGEVVLGVPMQVEAFDPSPEARTEIKNVLGDGPRPQDAFALDGRPLRRLYRTGNRDVGQDPFRWVPLYQVSSVSRPQDAVLLERRAWGVWIGTPQAVFVQDERRVPDGEPLVADASMVVDGRTMRVTREVIRTESDGSRVVRERRYLSAEPREAWEVFQRLLPDASARADRIRHMQDRDIGRINHEQEWWRQRLNTAEFAAQQASARGSPLLSPGAWAAVVVAAAGSVLAGWGLRRWAGGAAVPRSRRLGRLAAAMLWCMAPVGLMGAWLERPWVGSTQAHEDLARTREEAKAALERLGADYQRTMERVREIQQEDARYRVVFVDAAGERFAPVRMTELDEPALISQIIRAVPANTLGLMGKVGVYLGRWWEYLSGVPREFNTEGGVLPVIFGTVLLTILLSVVVVPLGVVAALYLREYARQGVLTSLVRIAVNNLAGVPSIVYGVFGLGFFCYTMGGFVDGGPAPAAQLPRAGWGSWWFVMLGGALVVFAALAFGLLARPSPGSDPTGGQRWLRRISVACWGCSAVLVVTAVATTPYFSGFFRANLPNPTFGTRGLLWAALTLALLTLPVVIVATEEAIAAVPRSMREGSYGCGASKWQTIKRIVLPGAMPGIMTGMILAMARGAGEVAPLMLVGAAKKADDLPFSAEFPFLHLERGFMHLGFHIYDLGFQSPDSEAARPLVWTTTLLLITIVVLLNLVAISIRARLRARLRHGQF
jgi:ABC-type phosphate transport system permease subunit